MDVDDEEIPYLVYRGDEPPHVAAPTGTWTDRAVALADIDASVQPFLDDARFDDVGASSGRWQSGPSPQQPARQESRVHLGGGQQPTRSAGRDGTVRAGDDARAPRRRRSSVSAAARSRWAGTIAA